MLEELHVRDLALINEAWLEFGPGMTVLTGETGAGKTALLGALKLLLGERADSAAVRSGADEALIEGRFTSVAGGETLVRRRVSADGRSRCSIDGEMATVGALAEAIGPRVDLHGQHEHQALLGTASHVGYLDRWAGQTVEEARNAYAAAYEAHREAVAYHADLADRLQRAARDADYLRFVADEIGRVAPLAREDAELEARLPSLQHAERLAQAAHEAAEALRGEGGATDRVADALAALGRVQGIDPAVDDLAERLGEVLALADDAGATARAYGAGIEHDPQVLDATLERLAALSGLKRKYGPSLDDVRQRHAEATAALEQADEGGELLEVAAASVERARDLLEEYAKTLARRRGEAAPGFVAMLGAAVEGLAMQGSRFEVSFTELEFERWTADGPQRVEFLYAPAPSQPARPLARIASGGEISRVMLALKVVLGRADAVATLVFDEVDAGIGGAAATAVGARLAQLALTHQVIVVTHLAQVAAFAGEHLVVVKSVEGSDVRTEVRPVSQEERVAEIARMLSGGETDAGLAHARELLDEAKETVTAL